MADGSRSRTTVAADRAATSRPPTSRATSSRALDAQAVGAVVGAACRSSSAALLLGVVAVGYQIADRHRHVGPEPDGRLGVRHHELRVLDRHRPRRHADLGDSLSAAAALAHVGQPRGRGDDALRRDVRGPLSADPHGPAVAGLLDAALSEHARFAVGQLPLAARSGTSSPSARTSRSPRSSGTSG